MSFLVSYPDSDTDEVKTEETSESESTEEVSYSSADVVANVLDDIVTLAVVKREVPGMLDHRDIKVEYESEEEDEESSSSDDDDADDEDEDDNDSMEDKDSPIKSSGKEKQPNQAKKNKKKASSADCDIQLPPIEDLHISVPEEACALIGTVESIVDDLVVVKALPMTPAIDLDSVLFLDTGARPLGKVFDVLGRVNEPFYCVRFNSNDHIREKEVTVGQEVYCAPKTEHTAFIFVEQLRRMKGSDASWKDNLEPPPRFIDYSDDEEERNARKARKANKTGQNGQAQEAQQIGVKRTSHGNAVAASNSNSNSNNPFYRRNRHYNPRDYGPIRWNSPHTPTVASNNAFSAPPPQVGFVRPPMFSVPPPQILPSNNQGGSLPNPFAPQPQQQQQQHPPPALQDLPLLFGRPPPPPPPQ